MGTTIAPPHQTSYRNETIPRARFAVYQFSIQDGAIHVENKTLIAIIYRYSMIIIFKEKKLL